MRSNDNYAHTVIQNKAKHHNNRNKKTVSTLNEWKRFSFI